MNIQVKSVFVKTKIAIQRLELFLSENELIVLPGNIFVTFFIIMQGYLSMGSGFKLIIAYSKLCFI